MGLFEEMLHVCKSCHTGCEMQVSDTSEEEHRVNKIMLLITRLDGAVF